MTRTLISGGLILVVATFAASVSNYVFQVLAGRILGPESYGLLSALFTVVAVATISASSLQAACAKEVAREQLDPKADHPPATRITDDPVVRAAFAAGIAAMVVTLIASPVITTLLDAGYPEVATFALMLPPVALVSVAFGRLQGLERFVAYAVLGLGMAGGKLALGLGALAIGLGVSGGLMALVVVSAAGAGFGLHWSREAGLITITSVRRDVVRALLAIGLFTLILSIDIPIARALMSSNAAGQFAAAAVIGHGVIWLPGVVALVAFPEMVKSRAATGDDAWLLLRSALMAGLMCAAGAVLLYLSGDQLFEWFYGDRYPDAPDLAWKIGVATIPLAVANLLIFHHLAGRTSKFILLIAGTAAVQVAGFVAFGTSATGLIAVDLGAGLLLMVVLIPWRRSMRSPSVSRAG